MFIIYRLIIFKYYLIIFFFSNKHRNRFLKKLITPKSLRRYNYPTSKTDCIKFLAAQNLFFDSSFNESIYFKTLHCNKILGNLNTIKLNRLLMLISNMNDLTSSFNLVNEFIGLSNEYIIGNGNRNLGLILHKKLNTIVYVTKIISDKGTFEKEVYFYENIRKLNNITSITPRLIYKREFQGIFLLTTEFIQTTKIFNTILIDPLSEFLTLSETSSKEYGNLNLDYSFKTPTTIIEKIYYNITIYQNILLLSTFKNIDIILIRKTVDFVKTINYEDLEFCLSHNDNSPLNFIFSNGVLKILDWESYDWNLVGNDYLNYCFESGCDVNIIKEFYISSFYKLTNSNHITLVLLFVLNIQNLLNYYTKMNTTLTKQAELINFILNLINSN